MPITQQKSKYLLERDETRRVSSTNTWSTVLDWGAEEDVSTATFFLCIGITYYEIENSPK